MASITDKLKNSYAKLQKNVSNSTRNFVTNPLGSAITIGKQVWNGPVLDVGRSLATGPGYWFKTLPYSVNRANIESQKYLQMMQQAKRAQELGNKDMYNQLTQQGFKARKNARFAENINTYIPNTQEVMDSIFQGKPLNPSLRGQAALQSGTAGVRTALTGKGLQNPAAVMKALPLTATIGGGIQMLAGGDIAEGIGQGVSSAPRLVGLNSITQPVFDKAYQAISPSAGRLTQMAGKFGVGATTNLAEDQLYTLATEGRLPTGTENVFSVVLGGVTGTVYKAPDGKIEKIKVKDGEITWNEKAQRWQATGGKFAKNAVKWITDRGIEAGKPTKVRIMRGGELVEEYMPKWQADLQFKNPVGLQTKNIREGIVPQPQSTVGGVDLYHGTGEVFDDFKSMRQLRNEGVKIEPSNVGGNSPFIHLTANEATAKGYASARARNIGGKPTVKKVKVAGNILDLTKHPAKYTPAEKELLAKIGNELKEKSGGAGPDAFIGGGMSRSGKVRSSYMDVNKPLYSFNDIERSEYLPELLKKYNLSGIKFTDRTMVGGMEDTFAILPEVLSKPQSTVGGVKTGKPYDATVYRSGKLSTDRAGANFFATDKSVAEGISRSRGTPVDEYSVKLENPYVVGDRYELFRNLFGREAAEDVIIRGDYSKFGFSSKGRIDPSQIEEKIFVPELRKRGYDGLILKSGQDELPEVITLNNKVFSQSQPQSTVGGVTTKTSKGLINTQTGNKPQVSKVLPLGKTASTDQSLGKISPQSQTIRIGKQQSQPLDSIIAEGRKQIGTLRPEVNKPVKQSLDDLYTQWVDRYNPLTKASQKAKGVLKAQGAQLRPEYDPEYLVRRLTGAGGIADHRFKTELNPVLKQIEQANIPKIDIDSYLASKRIAGFGKVGREIYGADPKKASQIVSALEQKYPGINQIADQLYTYQNKGFKEMIDAGFISPEAAKTIQSQNPDYSPLYRVMDEMDEYLGLPTRKTMQGTQPIQKIKGSTKQIDSPLESIIGNTFRQRAAIEKNRVAQSIVGLQNMADMGFKKVAKSGNDTITIWNNGKKEFWSVGQDIADTAKGVNEESMNMVLKILQAPASLLRQGATGRNPEFMIPNVVRDQLDAGITSKYGYIPFVDFTRGLIELGKKDLNTVFGTKFNTELYDKWANSGAKIDLGELSGRKSISKLFNEKTAKKGLFSWLGDTLDVLGRYSEQPTRIGLFKKAYQKTGNELLAAMESRDATVDFARMGSKMKVANSIIPFLNVGVQGFDKLIRAVKNQPGKVLFNMALYGATPAAAITAYNLANFKEEYSEIPEYEKESNFVLVKGRNPEGTVDYVTIPKGNVLPIVTNPIQSFMEHVAGVDGKSFGEMATNLLSEVLPVLSTGSTPKEVALKTIGSNLPQAIKPAAEGLLNKSFYKYDPNKEQSKEIVPYYLQNKPPYQQTYEFTPQMYQKLGAAINASPLQLKNLMEGYLAGYTKIPAQIVESLYNVSRGEAVSPNDKTILRRFIKQTYPSSGQKPKEEIKSPGFMERLTGKASAAETITPLPTRTEDLEVLYKDALSAVSNYPENKVKAQYGLVEKDLEEYQAEFDQANALLRRIRQEKPEQVFEVELGIYNKDGSAKIKDRTKWVIDQLKQSDDPTTMIKKLYEGQVLTQSVVEELNEKYGLGLTKYNYGDGYRNLPGKGGKSKKTISDAQILSAYKKALEAVYKAKKRKDPGDYLTEMRKATRPFRIKRYVAKALTA